MGITMRVNSVPTKSADMPMIHDLSSCPTNGTFVLLFGDSGYVTTPYRCEVGRYVAEYDKAPWRNHANDGFEDSGPAPLGWLPLPPMYNGMARFLGAKAGPWRDEEGWWFAHGSRRVGPFATQGEADLMLAKLP